MTTDTSPAPSPWLMGTAILGGTATWAGRFAVGYLLVPTACNVGTWLLHVVHGVAILVAAGTVLLAVTLLRRGADATTRFLLMIGAGLNAFFLGVILLESSSTFFVDACAKGAIP